MKTYGHNGMLHNSLETTLKAQKAVLEIEALLSSSQLAGLTPETFDFLDWNKR